MFRHRFCFRPLWLVPVLGLALGPNRASASPRTVANLGLNGFLWGNQVSSSFQFEDERLSTLNLNLAGSGLRADAGNVSAHWDELGFAGRSFRGLALGLPTGKIETTLLGGAVAVSDFEGREQNSALYGLRAALPLGSGFRLSASQLWTPGAPLDQGKSLNTLALAFTPDARQKVALELARSEHGNGWQLSYAAQSKRLSLQTSYRRVDAGFSTAGNPLLRTNRSGYFANLRYRLARPLSVTATSQHYKDALGGDSRFLGASVQFAPRNAPTLTLFSQSSSGAPAGALLLTPQLNQTASQSAGVRLSHNLGATYLTLGAERLRFSGSAAGDNSTDRFSLGVVRPIGQQTLLTFFSVLDRARFARQSSGNSRFNELHLNHRFGRGGLSLDVGLQQLRNRSQLGSGRSLATRVGFSVPLQSGSSFGLAYRTNLSGAGLARGGARSDLIFSYSRGFQIGKRPRGSTLPATERAQLGAVAGRVFEDTNDDGQWQPGEPAVPDVVVEVRSDVQAQTGENGRFVLKNLRPGDTRLQLQMKTLPIEFTPRSSFGGPLHIPTGQTVTVDFPVVRTGQIQGTVFRDANRNNVQDAGEAPVSGAIVRVEGSDIISFCDDNGHFTLAALPPRKWKITLDQASLNENDEPTTSGLEINVPPNGQIQGVSLGIAPREREVISTFEKISDVR